MQFRNQVLRIFNAFQICRFAASFFLALWALYFDLRNALALGWKQPINSWLVFAEIISKYLAIAYSMTYFKAKIGLTSERRKVRTICFAFKF